MVYVLNIYGQPLMPTDRYGKVRRLLRDKKAKVVKRCPFTIQLLYESTNHTQPVTLGVDAGGKHIGLSATTEDKVLYEADVTLRTDVSDLITTRRQNRRSRRSRKTRYRKARFNNRVRTKHKGWLAPSIENKIQSHMTMVDKVCKLLPVTDIIVETASFDIQKIKNPDISGAEYQQGELLNFANLREYCFWRDNYTCQWCKGRSKNKILHMHHWNYWNNDHTNKPDSVITLCDTCNDSKNHKPDGFLWGWSPKITHSYKDAAFMGIMRWTFYNRLKEKYFPLGINVGYTYGYITKATRITHNLPKEHYIDARCISGHPQAVSTGEVFHYRKIRCHNRQIHKCTVARGGKRKLNQAPFIVRGFRLFDKVLYQKQECFITGRRSTGYFALKLLDGTKVHNSVNCKKLKLIETRKHYMTERREPSSHV